MAVKQPQYNYGTGRRKSASRVFSSSRVKATSS
jgi:hypothetical protein